jgi:hypothetical protein
LEDCGVILDTQYATSLPQTFSYCFVTRLPKISALNVSDLIDRTFNGASQLVTIDEFELKENGLQTFNKVFDNCTALQNITITGTIGNNISFANSSQLTKDSIWGKVATTEQIANKKNLVELNGAYYYGGIFGALKDYSGSGTPYTLTLGTTNLAKLSNEEKAIATRKGWTLA